jgi:arsenate reductase
LTGRFDIGQYDGMTLFDSVLDDAEATALAAALKALAHPVRLRILSTVATAPTGEVCACVFPESLDKAQPTVSHHLGQLTAAGLLEREQRGKWAWFRLRPERLADVRRALGEGGEHRPVAQPSVLFLCVHNAGRSQMAAGWLRHLAAGRVEVYSAGSAPAASINPIAIEAMAEVGIDIAGAQPQRWTDEMARAADVIVTMGCGDECPVYPGRRRLDWELADPAGQDLAMVRGVRDEIRRRVETLVDELTPRCCG